MHPGVSGSFGEFGGGSGDVFGNQERIYGLYKYNDPDPMVGDR